MHLTPGSLSRINLTAAAMVAIGVTTVSVIDLSAHRVLGRSYPSQATALVQSPTASPRDLPVPFYNTGLSVVCIKVTNTSPADTRITALGLELPGAPSGFSLVWPVNTGLRLQERVTTIPGFPGVTLDLLLRTEARAAGGPPTGLAPGAPPALICLSGPFDPAVPIETMLNGVFVKFEHASGIGGDIGTWERRP
jgi:hypothetical protein